MPPSRHLDLLRLSPGAPQWGEQTAYIRHTWKVGSIIAAFFVLFNLLFQLIPAAAILVAREEKQKKFVKVGIGCLLAVMLVQTLAYSVLWNYQFFARNFAVGVRYQKRTQLMPYTRF